MPKYKSYVYQLKQLNSFMRKLLSLVTQSPLFCLSWKYTCSLSLSLPSCGKNETLKLLTARLSFSTGSRGLLNRMMWQRYSFLVSFNRPTLDILSSKAYFYLSLPVLLADGTDSSTTSLPLSHFLCATGWNGTGSLRFTSIKFPIN